MRRASPGFDATQREFRLTRGNLTIKATLSHAHTRESRCPVGRDALGGDSEDASNSADEDSTVLLEQFLAILKEHGSILDIEATVDLTALDNISGMRERADKIAGLVWEVLGYRFVCVISALSLRKKFNDYMHIQFS